MSMRIAIFGAGDLGQLIAWHAGTAGMQVAGFLDDLARPGSTTQRGPVLGTTDAASELFRAGAFEAVVVGIGYRHFEIRRRLWEDHHQSIPFASVIHPSCYVDSSCSIGTGVVLLPGCTLDYGVTIEDNVLLNTGCVVAHDTKIGRHSFLAPAVHLAGFIGIGEEAFLGIGTTVIDNVRIASQVQTGGGTVVIRDLTEPGLYVGSPARFIR